MAGSNGFITKFFQNSWVIIKEDLINKIVYFFLGDPYPKLFTPTFIALILKSNTINFWNDYRPISLCTFFNKLISKNFMGRLALILPNIISLE